MQEASYADLSSGRLTLVAITTLLLHSEQRSIEDLALSLDVAVPHSWPPEHWEAGTRDFLLKAYEVCPQLIEWHRFIVLREPETDPTLVGMVGAFRADPTAVECEIGYTIMPDFAGRGIATEAALMLLALLHEDDTLEAVIAHTFPSLVGSRRVLEKCGFVNNGSGDEAGTVRYRLRFTV